MYRQHQMKDFEAPYVSGELAAQSGESLAPQINYFPRLLLTLFNGGKDSGSKVRFSKFYLIIDLAPQDLLMADTAEGAPEKFDAYKAVLSLYSNIEKAVAA